MPYRKSVVIVLIAVLPAIAEELKPATVAAFNHYVSRTEQRMNKEINSGGFLWIDTASARQRDEYYARLHKGEVLTQRVQTLEDGREIQVPNGLIHHWVGLVFIPGASLAGSMEFLQDYDDQYKFYAPDIQRSRLISRKGNDFHVYLRLRRKKVVTVVLNTEYDVHYTILGNDRANARSYSTRIAEVEHGGEAKEAEKPVGNDSGFLWRLNSYWRFWQRDGGTYVQLEAISLTRDIPAGLGWLIRPLVTTVPQESLQFTLGRTRTALGVPGVANPARSARNTSGRKPKFAGFTLWCERESRRPVRTGG